MTPEADLFTPSREDRQTMQEACRRLVEGAAGQGWKTLAEMAAIAGCSEHAVSARLSDLRRRHHLQVDARPPLRENGRKVIGQWTYRVHPSLDPRGRPL